MKASSPTSRLPGCSQQTPVPARQPTRHIIRARALSKSGSPLSAVAHCGGQEDIAVTSGRPHVIWHGAFDLFWAMRRGMTGNEHEGGHGIAGLLALPARHSGRATRWFPGEEDVVIFHPIRNADGAPGSALC